MAAAAAAVVWPSPSPGRTQAPLVLEGNSVVAVNPVTSAIEAEVPVGGSPTMIAVGLGRQWAGAAVGADAVWAAGCDGTLLRFDPCPSSRLEHDPAWPIGSGCAGQDRRRLRRRLGAHG